MDRTALRLAERCAQDGDDKCLKAVVELFKNKRGFDIILMQEATRHADIVARSYRLGQMYVISAKAGLEESAILLSKSFTRLFATSGDLGIGSETGRAFQLVVCERHGHKYIICNVHNGQLAEYGTEHMSKCLSEALDRRGADVTFGPNAPVVLVGGDFNESVYDRGFWRGFAPFKHVNKNGVTDPIERITIEILSATYVATQREPPNSCCSTRTDRVPTGLDMRSQGDYIMSNMKFKLPNSVLQPPDLASDHLPVEATIFETYPAALRDIDALRSEPLADSQPTRTAISRSLKEIFRKRVLWGEMFSQCANVGTMIAANALDHFDAETSLLYILGEDLPHIVLVNVHNSQHRDRDQSLRLDHKVFANELASIRVLSGRTDVPHKLPLTLQTAGRISIKLFGVDYDVGEAIVDDEIEPSDEDHVSPRTLEIALRYAGPECVALRMLTDAAFDTGVAITEVEKVFSGENARVVTAQVIAMSQRYRAGMTKTAWGIMCTEYGMKLQEKLVYGVSEDQGLSVVTTRRSPTWKDGGYVDVTERCDMFGILKNCITTFDQDTLDEFYVAEQEAMHRADDAMGSRMTTLKSMGIEGLVDGSFGVINTYASLEDYRGNSYTINHRLLEMYVVASLGGVDEFWKAGASNAGLGYSPRLEDKERKDGDRWLTEATVPETLASLNFAKLRATFGRVGPAVGNDPTTVIRLTQYIAMDGVPFHQRETPFQIVTPTFMGTSLTTKLLNNVVLDANSFAPPNGVCLILHVPSKVSNRCAIYMEGVGGRHAIQGKGEHEILFKPCTRVRIDSVVVGYFSNMTYLFGTVLPFAKFKSIRRDRELYSGHSGGNSDAHSENVPVAPVLDVGGVKAEDVDALSYRMCDRWSAVSSNSSRTSTDRTPDRTPDRLESAPVPQKYVGDFVRSSPAISVSAGGGSSRRERHGNGTAQAIVSNNIPMISISACIVAAVASAFFGSQS